MHRGYLFAHLLHAASTVYQSSSAMYGGKWKFVMKSDPEFLQLFGELFQPPIIVKGSVTFTANISVAPKENGRLYFVCDSVETDMGEIHPDRDLILDFTWITSMERVVNETEVIAEVL